MSCAWTNKEVTTTMSRDLRSPLLPKRKHRRGSELDQDDLTGLIQLLLQPNSSDGFLPFQRDFVEYRCKNLQWRLGGRHGLPEGVHIENPQDSDAVAALIPHCSSWPHLDRSPSRGRWRFLSPEFEFKLRQGLPKMWHQLHSHVGIAVQISVLVLVVASYAACPLVVSWAKVVDHDRSGAPIKGRPFKESSVILTTWCVTALVGLTSSMLLHGFRGVRRCFDCSAIIRFAPAGMGWALADTCEVLAVDRLDPATYGMITQARLLGAAAACWLARGSKQTTLQWGVLGSLTLACVGYCLVPDDSAKPAKQQLLGWRVSHAEFRVLWHFGLRPPPEEVVADDDSVMIGVLFALGKVALSVFSGIYAEMCFKPTSGSEPAPLYVQMTQISFSSIVFSFFLYLCLCLMHNDDPSAFFEGPDGHWSRRTLLIVAVFFVREWICNACIKYFDDLVKNICNAAALVITYIFTVAVTGEKQFNAVKGALLLIAATDVVNYVTTRRSANTGETKR